MGKKIRLIISLLLFLLVVGCGSYWDIEEQSPKQNQTNTFEKKVLEKLEVIETTKCPDCICNTPQCPDCILGEDSYINGLKQEANKCEESLYYYNISDCHGELNWTREELDRVKEKCEEDKQDIKSDFDEYKNDTKNIDDELRLCKRDLCKFNSTKC